MSDLEAVSEKTPLMALAEPPPLRDIKAETLKEKIVAGLGAVSCKYIRRGIQQMKIRVSFLTTGTHL
jgi:hypothetical protein